MARIKTCLFALAIFTTCQLVHCAPADGAVTDADLASPAGTLAVFRKALENGDTANLAAVSVGDAAARDWAFAEASQLKALRDLESALSKRFGAGYAADDKGKQAADRIADSRDDDLRADLARARLREKAGEVLLDIDEATPDDRQGRLVKVDGRWKVDLASLSEYRVPADVPVMKAVAAAAAALARDVSAGKFAEIDEAADALDERLAAAVDSALPHKTPATQESPRESPRLRPGAK